MVKLVEIYEQPRYTSERPNFTLREVFVNPEHVVCVREDLLALNHLQEGNLPEGLMETKFSKIHLNRGQNGIDLVVIGGPEIVQEKLGLRRTLLKG